MSELSTGIQNISISNQKERVCLTRGSIESMNAMICDMSFGLEMKQDANQFLYHDQFFDIDLDRQCIYKFTDDVDSDKKSRMSEENQLFIFQKISEISRASHQSRGGTNLIFKHPQGKNSDQLILQLGDPFDGNFQFQRFSDTLNNSNRNSNQNLRISSELNLQGELEIVMEWTGQPINPMELQEMVEKLSLCDPVSLNQRPDRLSMLPQKLQVQGCICKKTKCLKLYCQCFQAGRLCVKQCECLDCCNNDSENQERSQAISQMIDRNTNVFKVDIDSQEQQQQLKRLVVKGCNCKRSKCMKKYCECYNSGMICGPLCNCDNCLNIYIAKDELLHDDFDKQFLDVELVQEEQLHQPYKKFKI